MNLWLDDVTLQTAHYVVTAVCRWRPDSNSGSESIGCLCAVDASGQLILFEQSSTVSWQATNLSDTLNRHFGRVQPVHARAGCVFFDRADASDNPQAWNDVLLLPDDQGHLVMCHLQPGMAWQMVDISADCSQCIDRACRPIVWEQHSAGIHSLHALAVAEDGRLLEFFMQAGQHWQCLGTGHTCTPASLSLSGGATSDDNASQAENIMAFSVNLEGLLYRHFRAPGERVAWQNEQISSSETPRLRAHSTAAFVVADVCHVAACDVFGSVLVYQQCSADMHRQDWPRIDVTAQTGCRARAIGNVTLQCAKLGADPTTDCSPTSILLSAYGNGRAYGFWWNEQQDWQVTDIEQAFGIRTRVAGHAGLTDTQDEFLAIVTKGRLVLCHGLAQLRSMAQRLVTSGPNRGHPEFSRQRRYVCRVVAWQEGSNPVPELRAIGEAVFGSRTLQRNAASYLDYVSGSAFTLQRDDVIGWFGARDGESMAGTSSDKYQQDSNRQTPLSSERIRQRFQQAIHLGESMQGAADPGGQSLDTQAGELSRLMIVAHDGECQALSEAPSEAAERVLWPIGDSISVIRLVQEVLATCARLPRLPQEGERYDLMALDSDSFSDRRFLHPNGAWKLLMGWVRPRLATRPMRYCLRAVADSREVIVLVRQESHAVEYFVMENRQRRPMDDVSVPGLLVWHVLNHSGHSSVGVPSLNTAAEWQVTLASAVIGDATSSNPLFWADGIASGYTLLNVSPAADVMSFDLERSSATRG